MSSLWWVDPSFEGMTRAGVEPAQRAFTPRLNPSRIRHRSPSPLNTQDPSECLVVRQVVSPLGRTTNFPRCYYATYALRKQLSRRPQERRRCYQYLPWWWVIKVHIREDCPDISIIVHRESFDNGRLKRNTQNPAPDYQYSSQIKGGGPCVIN